MLAKRISEIEKEIEQMVKSHNFLQEQVNASINSIVEKKGALAELKSLEEKQEKVVE